MLLLMAAPLTVRSQSGSTLPCTERETHVSRIPTASTEIFCLERVVELNNAPEMSFTALATFPDGRLFTISPTAGTLIEITDTNDDAVPDTPIILAEALERPASLTTYQDALYITGGSMVYRWTEDGGLETLVSDLPSGTGYWNGGIAVGGIEENERLYVGVGARCDLCDEALNDTEHGVILSFALDGSDRQLIATGFLHPSGLMWYQDSLWVTDVSPQQLSTGRYDELNRINLSSLGDIPDYGAPFCLAGSTAIGSHNCDGTIPPVLTFSSGSNPIALTPYQGTAFTPYDGYLTIAFSGTAHASRMRGYTLEFFWPEGDTALTVVPAFPDRDQQYGGVGFYPHHVYGTALSPEGWIYISTGGGSIYVVRPVQPDPKR